MISKIHIGYVFFRGLYTLNRKIKKTWPNASVAAYKYDGAGNGIGLLWEKINAEGSTEFISYNEMGRVMTEKRQPC